LLYLLLVVSSGWQRERVHRRQRGQEGRRKWWGFKDEESFRGLRRQALGRPDGGRDGWRG
jgi:hypothetical protein